MATTRKKAKPGRSLAELDPEVATEWHPTKNGVVKPSDVNAGSNEKYWWQCSFNKSHEWPARIANRTTPRLRLGCPHCNPGYRSQIEINLAHELRLFFDFDINAQRVRTSRIYNADIVIENERLIVEFDGHFWHANRYEQDTKKTQDLQDSGWTVIRVRENLDKVTDNDVVIERHPHKNAKSVANSVLQKIEKVKNIKLENLGVYLENSEPQNARAAKEYYANLLRDKKQTTL
jgi:very-short-patch-repair endonuclease